MQQYTQPTSNTCTMHSLPITHLCLGQNCSSRLCCLTCTQSHNNDQIAHPFYAISEESNEQIVRELFFNQISNSYLKNQKQFNHKDRAPLANAKKIFQSVGKLLSDCTNITQIINHGIMTLIPKIMQPFNVIMHLYQGQLAKYCHQAVSSGNGTEIEKIVEVLRFLGKGNTTNAYKINNQTHLIDFLTTIQQKILQLSSQWKTKMQNLFSQLYANLDKAWIRNWVDIYTEKQNKNKHSFTEYKPSREQQKQANKPIQKQSQKITGTHQVEIKQKKQFSLIISSNINEKQLKDKQKQKQKQNKKRFKYSKLDQMDISEQMKDTIQEMFSSIFKINADTNTNFQDIPHEQLKLNRLQTVSTKEKEFNQQKLTQNRQKQNQIKNNKHVGQTSDLSSNQVKPPVNKQKAVQETKQMKKTIQSQSVTLTLPITKMEEQETPSFPTVINVPPKTASQQDQPFIRKILATKNISKPLSKSSIMHQLTNMSKDNRYTSMLRDFIIEGPNQFDKQCLQMLASHFPHLKKFNYVWNFEQDGLRLQKEQVFFQKIHSMEKDPHDLQMDQQLFDIYAKLKSLQNICISQVRKFGIQYDTTQTKLKIKNENIRHLTLGQYVQSWQDQYLPYPLKNYTLSSYNLITLNIFNIKKIDGQFMERIILKNCSTLKNLWLSQCVDLEDRFIQSLKNSRLQSLILEQIHSITFALQLPETLQTLVLQNCQIFCSNPLKNLSQLRNLKSFSIFQSDFRGIENKKFIGDGFIQQLVRAAPKDPKNISQSKFESLCGIKYLNFGECRGLTDASIPYLQKMGSLRQLCIDNTEISLISLSKADVCLSKIKKLGIVGLKAQSQSQNPHLSMQSIIECVLQKCPKLQTLSLDFHDQFTKIKRQSFRNLKHMSISARAYKKNYSKQNLKQFRKIIHQSKKSVNIV